MAGSGGTVGMNEARKAILELMAALKRDCAKMPELVRGVELKHFEQLVKWLKPEADYLFKSHSLDLISHILQQPQHVDIVRRLLVPDALIMLEEILLNSKVVHYEKDLSRVLIVLNQLLANQHPFITFSPLLNSGIPAAVSNIFIRYSDIILSTDFQKRSPELAKRRGIYVWGSAVECLALIQKVMPKSFFFRSPSTSNVDQIVIKKVVNILHGLVCENFQLSEAETQNVKKRLLYYLANLTSKELAIKFYQQQGLPYIVQLLRKTTRFGVISEDEQEERLNSITEILLVIRNLIVNGLGRPFLELGLMILLILCLKTFVVILVKQTYDQDTKHYAVICIYEILCMLFRSEPLSIKEFVKMNGSHVLNNYKEDSSHPANAIAKHLISLIEDKAESSVETDNRKSEIVVENDNFTIDLTEQTLIIEDNSGQLNELEDDDDEDVEFISEQYLEEDSTDDDVVMIEFEKSEEVAAYLRTVKKFDQTTETCTTRTTTRVDIVQLDDDNCKMFSG